MVRTTYKRPLPLSPFTHWCCRLLTLAVNGIGVILNYALTLEHLEDTFYRDGLNQFTQEDFTNAGFDESFYNNIKKVAQDESDHVGFISGALEGKSSHKS
jgi:hypothetical protein